jgi:energy-coupling factor transporter ATP-binding protein EcfA2
VSTGAAVALRGFGFQPSGSSRWAVSDVDLVVQPGERVLLLGGSGSGKSTVLRAVAGLLDAGGAVAGEVLVHGRPAPAARGHVGLLLQDPEAGLVLSRAGEDVAFGPQNQGCSAEEVTCRVTESLRAVGFAYPRDHPVAALSGGERQRLALAGVLAMRPDVLLLDEPTSMLDPVGAELIRATVGRIADETGCALVVVEHDVDRWLDLVDRVVILGSDGVAADGTPEQVRRSPAAASTWLVHDRSIGRAATMPGQLLLRGETLTFCHRGARRPALEDVDVALRSGGTVAVAGQNGSGKTTLARLLGGLVAPTSGAVTASTDLTGRTPLPTPPHRWRPSDLAGRIGSVFQNPEHAFLATTTRSELMIGPLAQGSSETAAADRADELIGRLRLESVADQNPFSLSGGEQRRLSVGAAIATSPRVLVLDEPTFGQDPTTWREVVELTASMATSGAGVVVATHDRDFRTAVADEVLVLERTAVAS